VWIPYLSCCLAASRTIVHIIRLYDPEITEKWNEALRSNPDIRNWKTERLEERIECLEERLAELPALLDEAKRELET
jgi:hypothetical protein